MRRLWALFSLLTAPCPGGGAMNTMRDPPTGLCPTGRWFMISKWISFSWGLDTYHIATFALGPEVNKFALEPFKSGALSSLQPFGSPRGKPHWFSKPDVLGAHLFGTGPSGCGAWCGVWTPCFLGRSSVFVRSSWLWVTTLWVEYYQDLFSSPSQCGPFILCCAGTAQLVSRPFSEGMFPQAAGRLVCLWEEASSGSSYTTMLNCLLNSIFKNWKHSCLKICGKKNRKLKY